VTRKGLQETGVEMEETRVGGPSVVGGDVHVADDNVLASSHISGGEAGGFDRSSMLWVMYQVVDRLQLFCDAFRINYGIFKLVPCCVFVHPNTQHLNTSSFWYHFFPTSTFGLRWSLSSDHNQVKGG
jgi:hypothetical protein